MGSPKTNSPTPAGKASRAVVRRVVSLIYSGREILSTLAKLAIPITVGASIIAATNILDSAILMDRGRPAGRWCAGWSR